ncbi:hypothetical protein B0H12DRAFT_1144148, partial [Mycena haematopus]
MPCTYHASYLTLTLTTSSFHFLLLLLLVLPHVSSLPSRSHLHFTLFVTHTIHPPPSPDLYTPPS